MGLLLDTRVESKLESRMCIPGTACISHQAVSEHLADEDSDELGSVGDDLSGLRSSRTRQHVGNELGVAVAQDADVDTFLRRPLRTVETGAIEKPIHMWLYKACCLARLTALRLAAQASWLP